MILPGHVAAAGIVARLAGVERCASLAASMFPDLIDKPMRWVLRATPNDRIPAHTAVAWALTTGLVGLVVGGRAAAGWSAGYGAHLLCDQVNSYLNPGHIYFWWPLKRYAMHTGPIGLSSSLADFRPASLLLEAAVALAGLLLWLGERRTA
ncbi:MAG: metal-dependent hydrolase [Anaerolineae bacterium]